MEGFEWSRRKRI